VPSGSAGISLSGSIPAALGSLTSLQKERLNLFEDASLTAIVE
jgi:hypothetical protein